MSLLLSCSSVRRASGGAGLEATSAEVETVGDVGCGAELLLLLPLLVVTAASEPAAGTVLTSIPVPFIANAETQHDLERRAPWRCPLPCQGMSKDSG